MNDLLHLIYTYRFSIAATTWYIVSALIVTLPEKGKPYSFYDHMYDFTHQLLNLRTIPGLSGKAAPSQPAAQ
jgi:hypothetical protein